MLKRFILPALIFSVFSLSAAGQTKFQKDFAYYWQTVNDNFAYFDQRHINWEKVKTIYQPFADTVQSRISLIRLLETVNNELYNGHVFLNTNTPSSNRLVPSGADVKISYSNNKFIITELREGYNAELCGLRNGMTVTKFNDIPFGTAILSVLPRSVTTYSPAMYEYAANFLLAGTHDRQRKITVMTTTGKEQDFYPDAVPNKTEKNSGGLLETKILSGNIVYIKINNSLGDDDLIHAFDSVLDQHMNTAGLILDLRETPGGGTTTIARAIMGRFTAKEIPYQKHIYTAEEKETGIRRSTLELVSPRSKIYSHPMIILIGYWTGSMGEGMAIGFDGMKRGKTVGTKMAGLLGEIYSFETPETKIPFSFPCVQLQHINGQPREDYVPNVLIKDQQQTLDIAAGLFWNTKKN